MSHYGGSIAPSRPLGVTIIALLQLLASLALLLVGLVFIVGGSLVGEFALGAVGGAFVLLFGIIGFIIFLGLWRGRSWAWYLELIFVMISLIGVVVTVLSGANPGILGVVLDLVIVYYIFRPNVKAFFNV